MIEIPEGYRVLGPDEVVAKGDLLRGCLSHLNVGGDWVGRNASEWDSERWVRKIDLPEGYRLMTRGETLKKGDMYYEPHSNKFLMCNTSIGWRDSVGVNITPINPKPEPKPHKELKVTLMVNAESAKLFAGRGDSTSQTLRRFSRACQLAIKTEEHRVKKAQALVEEVDRLHAEKMKAKELWTALAKATKAARRDLSEINRREES